MHWLSYFAGSACMAVILVVVVLVWLATFRKHVLMAENAYQREYGEEVLRLMRERNCLAREWNELMANDDFEDFGISGAKSSE